MSYLTRLALSRRSVVILLAIFISLGGAFVATRMKMELLPNFSTPVLTTVTTYPGAGPDTMEEAVTLPVESAFASVEGLKNLSSSSSADFSMVMATFNYGTNMEKATAAVNQNLRGLKLPQGADTPEARPVNLSSFPVLLLGFAGDKDQAEVERLVRKEILPRLSTIDGVFAAQILGGSQSRVEITLDPEKLARNALPISQITQLIQANNVSIPGGDLVVNGQVLPIRAQHKLGSLADLQNMIVGSVPQTPEQIAQKAPQMPVFLKDVATVRLAQSSSEVISRMRGKPAVGVAIMKTTNANTVTVADEVWERVHETMPSLPGITVETIMDQSTDIKHSINGLMREAGLGAIFAILVIFAFLLSVRSTMVTAVSLPTSMLIAILILQWRGITLNIMTLGGLTVAVGRVVDDSIVVLENIYRHVSRGDPVHRAAFAGTKEVAMAITSSTITTIAVFLPLGLVGGLVSELFRPFAYAVTFSLLASLFVALVIIPVLASFFITPSSVQRHGETWLQRLYTPAITWSLGHRALTLVVAGVLFVGSLGLLPFVGTSFLSNSSEKMLMVQLTMPPGTGRTLTLTEAEKVEQILAGLPETENYITVIGSPEMLALFLKGGESGGTLIAQLKPNADLPAVTERVRQQLARVGGPGLFVVSDGSSMGGGGSSLELTVAGSDLKKVSESTALLTDRVRNLSGVVNVVSNLTQARPTLDVNVDPMRAIALRLTATQVAMKVREAIVGQTVTTMQVDGQSRDVFVTVDHAKLNDAQALAALPISEVPSATLGEVASIRTVDGPVTLTRINQQRAATITGTITARNVGAVSREVDEIAAAIRQPGVTVESGGTLQEMNQGFSRMVYALIVAVVLVYLVMVASMGSLLSPFAILFSLPLASIGAVLALFATRRQLDMSALIGVLMLVGIVVTNAIVLLDLVHTLHGRGASVREALIEGGRTRVRPIIMTAAATVLALAPLAIGFEEGSVIAASLATVVIGGLFTSTLLTLIVVPVVYSLFVGLQQRRRKEKAATVVATPVSES